MKQFVLLFRQGRTLSEEEQKQRTNEVRAWALQKISEGRKLDPRILSEESNRVSPKGESPVIAFLFLEASDFTEAVKIAETHPGIRYGVNIEVREWTTPLAQPAPAQ